MFRGTWQGPQLLRQGHPTILVASLVFFKDAGQEAWGGCGPEMEGGQDSGPYALWDGNLQSDGPSLARCSNWPLSDDMTYRLVSLLWTWGGIQGYDDHTICRRTIEPCNDASPHDTSGLNEQVHSTDIDFPSAVWERW